MRKADGEQLTVEWIAGEQPRFELISKVDGRVLQTLALEPLNVEGIEAMLAHYSFESG